ncbi:MAG: hypothetical protein KJZ78_05480 [Bryobacteraceae bacterium]|nr:hypothetical protein [Bryobacteraceae bacterium]
MRLNEVVIPMILALDGLSATFVVVNLSATERRSEDAFGMMTDRTRVFRSEGQTR